MDFKPTDEQSAIAELAAQIFTGSSDADRVAVVEASDERFDRELWHQLAAADLLGVAIPEELGGLGFGMVELALVLEQQGAVVAPVPLMATLVGAALPIAEFGTDAQRQHWLPSILAGETVCTAALQEGGLNDPYTTSVVASRQGDGWSLHGHKPAVAFFGVADAVIVPARDDTGSVGLFVVPTNAAGLEATTFEATNREWLTDLALDGVEVGDDDLLGGAFDAARLGWLVDRALVGCAAMTLGCCEAATRMAAEYTSTREQFGRPLSTNQGVTLRAADCFIDTDCIRVTAQQAAWLLDEGFEARRAALTAKWWSADAGQRVVHATQHLHGGMGADIDYPVHRYFLWVKQLENTLGASAAQLARLGSRIVAER